MLCSTFTRQKPSTHLELLPGIFVRLISISEAAASMPAIEPKGDFLLFRETLTELERLVDVRDILEDIRDSLYYADHAKKAIAEGISYTLDLLTEYDVNTSESNSVEELERLVEMSLKVTEQNRRAAPRITKLHDERFDRMIDSKIDFIKNYPFSRHVSKGGLEPIAALERLAAVQRKIDSHRMDSLLEFKIREVVWRTRAKASSRHDLIVR